MNNIQHFRQLIVWQKAHQLFLDIAKDAELLPKTQTARVVIDQILRSSGSISANIAEGFGRRKGKEYLHYLIIARGSTSETLNWLIKCVDIGWIDKGKFNIRESLIEEIMKMLNKMIGQKIND
jgi:four helix bundle protein